MIAQWRRRDGELEFALWGKEVNRFSRDFGIERSFFFESRQKFTHGAGIEQGTGEAVLANLAGLFENINVFFAELRVWVVRVVLIDELREPQGTRHARRATAHDDNVGGHLGTFDVRERLAEN